MINAIKIATAHRISSNPVIVSSQLLSFCSIFVVFWSRSWTRTNTFHTLQRVVRRYYYDKILILNLIMKLAKMSFPLYLYPVRLLDRGFRDN